MRTFSDYFSVIEHQNLLRMENRADPLCHDDHGAVFDILRQCFSKRRIRFQVKCRKTVVENKDFRVFCNRTRNRQTLFLSAGYIRAALCNRGFVFVIFCLDKLGCLRNCGCLFDLRIRRIVFSEAQVGCDRSREQHTFLRHETDLIAQILHRNVSNIFSVERNLSARHIIETWDQVDQRRFTAAGASDDRRRLARLGNEVDVMQHILLGARITEVDVIEADNSVVNLQLLRIFDILNGGFCLNDFIDTAGGNSGTRQHD